jgi:PAS domain S-box-containing protein
MEPKHRLTKVFFLLLSVVSLASIGLMAILWINYELTRSEKESQRYTQEYYDSVELSLSQETNRVSEYIEAQTSSSQVKFYINIKNRVLEIWNMLEGLQTDPQYQVSDAQTKSLVLSVLSHFSYNGGRSNYFFSTLDGKVLIADGEKKSAPLSDDASTQNFYDPQDLSKALSSVKDIGEGFYRLTLLKPDDEKHFDEVPVTFLKLHPGFGWVVGASEFYSDFKKELGRELLGWTDNVPLPANENLLVLDRDGKVLSFGNPSMLGLNVVNDPQASSLKDIGTKVLDSVNHISKNYIRFTFTDSYDGKQVECVGFYRALTNWDWVVINWISSDNFEKALADQQALRTQDLYKQIYRVVFIALAMLLVVIVMSMIFSRKASGSFAAFFNFFEKAATTSIEIDPQAQQFSEFGQLAAAANSMIRQRREIERQLVESELKFRTIFDVTPQIIIIMDSSGRLLEANSRFDHYALCSVSEAQGRHLVEVMDMGEPAWNKIIGLFTSDNQLAGEELVIADQNGRLAYLLLFGKVMTILKQKYLLAICVDITERKLAENERAQLQEKLVRSQKMEAMGLMAASMAHELNNILSGLIGYPELMLRDGGLTKAQESQVREILEAGHRASVVVGDFMTLSKGIATSKVAIDLNDLIKKSLEFPTIRMSLNAIKAPVEINTNLSPGAAIVKGSPVHMKKLVLNLLGNALEAVSGNTGFKRITISTKNTVLNASPGFIDDFKPGSYVDFSVSDNGPGIPQETLSHIFEPFYSKKAGANRGLGLALVDLAAKEHGGGVSVVTSEQGTTFTVYIPMASGEKAVHKSARSLAEFKGQGERILVVDDMDIQRKLAQKMLKTLGYEPHCVASGEEAVEYLKVSEADLIILDMIMDPGINGRQTYEAILAFKPHQKAIIASGMAENEEVEKAQALGASHFVSKPYTLEDIAGAIHQALNSEGP